MSNLHTELYPALAEVTTMIHQADVELGRTLALFATQASPKLSAEERVRLATILEQTLALSAPADSADAADPAGPPLPAADGLEPTDVYAATALIPPSALGLF